MSSLKQIEANRRNAQLSTGPRTPEGKTAAARNALVTGIYAKGEVILPSELPEQLEALAAEYYEHYAPATPNQRCLVDSLVNDEWLLRRFRAIEAQLMSKAIRECFNPDPKARLAQGYSQTNDKLDLLQRRINATRRSYLRNMKALQELQSAAEPRKAAPAPVEENQTLPPEIGFVPPPPICPAQPTSTGRSPQPTDTLFNQQPPILSRDRKGVVSEKE